MRFRALSIQGFRSFTEDQRLAFPKGKGLYLLAGENRAEPELGANGAGKSSVWDALCWVLYGKTSRGLRAGAVSHWSEEHLCSVHVEFSVDGEVYGLTRTWNPNSLSMSRGDEEPELIEQDRITDLIGLDYDQFLATVLLGQYTRWFFDLSATEKLQVLTRTLHLDRWLSSSAAAKKVADDLRDESRGIVEELERWRGRVSALTESVERLKREVAESDRNRREARLRVQREINSLGIDGVSAKLARAEAGLKRVDDRLREVEKEVDTLDALRAEKLGDAEAVKRELDRAELDLCTTRERLSDSGRPTTCSNCGQEVSRRWLRDRLKERESECWRLRKKVAKLEIAIAFIDIELSELGLVRLQARRASREERVVVLRRKLSGLRTSRAVLREQLRSLSVSDDRGLRQEQGRLREALRKCRELDESRARIERKLGRVEFWVRGFKDVRLWIVDSALDELSAEVNSALVELGLVGWSVSFAVEREKKSGGVTRGFNVLIQSPGSPEQVPWEAWSGGETQRLRIAGAMGFGQLVRNGLRSPPELEVWDEPTTHLGVDGITDLLDSLHDRSRRLGRQVWVVDHRSLDYGGFDAGYVVVKTRLGSRIVKQSQLWQGSRRIDL